MAAFLRSEATAGSGMPRYGAGRALSKQAHQCTWHPAAQLLTQHGASVHALPYMLGIERHRKCTMINMMPSESGASEHVWLGLPLLGISFMS